MCGDVANPKPEQLLRVTQTLYPAFATEKPYFLRDLFTEIIISTPRTVGFGSYAGPRALDPEPSRPQSSLEEGSGGRGGLCRARLLSSQTSCSSLNYLYRLCRWLRPRIRKSSSDNGVADLKPWADPSVPADRLNMSIHSVQTKVAQNHIQGAIRT